MKWRKERVCRLGVQLILEMIAMMGYEYEALFLTNFTLPNRIVEAIMAKCHINAKLTNPVIFSLLLLRTLHHVQNAVARLN